jgi:myo-inositol 2-dehydrogenase / D-chiro-inositol 1-dehydrogenase
MKLESAIRIGLVGCGNRGSGACLDALSTPAPVQLVAMGDLFSSRLSTSLRNLERHEEVRQKIDVPPERRFTGFEACQKVLEAGVDLVLLATPPHFRPMHYAATVKAGKHVFLEKPCCVDAPGYRMLLAANEIAKAKRLSVVAGLQRRHQPLYLEKIKKIHDGAVGQVRLVRTYYNTAGTRAAVQRTAEMTELEYQIRSWNLFCWLSGDHLVEQACHLIDVANWVMEGHPISANGMGGRQVRVGPGTGDIWDSHVIEFEYADGARHYCQARQQPDTWSYVGEFVHGDQGAMALGVGPWGSAAATPRTLRSKQFEGQNPYQLEHNDLMASILGTGPYRFEGDYAATSSMTAVMGRMATYSGNLITWENAVHSELHLAPERYAFDAQPPVRPDERGNYPAAVPGVTRAL